MRRILRSERGSTTDIGASIWVFLLLASEAIKTYRANPYLEYVPCLALYVREL